MKKIYFLSLIYVFICCREKANHTDGIVVLKETIINFKIDIQSQFLKFGDFYMDMPEEAYNEIVQSKTKYLNDYRKKPNSLKKPLFLWGLDSDDNKILSFIPMTEIDSARHLHSYSMIFSTSNNNTFLGTNNNAEKRLKLKGLLADIIMRNIKISPVLHDNKYVWCFANCFLIVEEGIEDIVSINIVSDKKNEYCNYIQSGRREKDSFYYMDSLMKVSKKECQ